MPCPPCWCCPLKSPVSPAGSLCFTFFTKLPYVGGCSPPPLRKIPLPAGTGARACPWWGLHPSALAVPAWGSFFRTQSAAEPSQDSGSSWEMTLASSFPGSCLALVRQHRGGAPSPLERVSFPWELLPELPGGLEELSFEAVLRRAVKKGLIQPPPRGQRAPSIHSCCPLPSTPWLPLLPAVTRGCWGGGAAFPCGDTTPFPPHPPEAKPWVPPPSQRSGQEISNI